MHVYSPRWPICHICGSAVGEIIKIDVRGRMSVSTERRQRLLAEYDQSGLSARKFAQWAGIKDQTLANWLQKRRGLGSAPAQPTDSGSVAGSGGEKPQTSGRPETAALLVALPGGARMDLQKLTQTTGGALA